MARHKVSLVAPPAVLLVNPGDEIEVNATFNYQGPGVPEAWAQIACYSMAFGLVNEKVRKNVSFPLADSQDSPTHVVLEPIVLTLPSSGMPAGLLYGLYVKIYNVAGKEFYVYCGPGGTPEQTQVETFIIEVTGALSEITNLRIASYNKV